MSAASVGSRGEAGGGGGVGGGHQHSHNHHSSGIGPLSLMSCVRESSPQPETEHISQHNIEKHASSKKKFWNPKRWFKRKQHQSEENSANLAENHRLQCEVQKDGVRSRSTSELSDVEDDVRRRSTSSMHHPTNLSLSHDSVFQSPHSGSSEMELDAAQSSSSLSISTMQPFNQKIKTELCSRLRLRRGHGDTSEDDEGLPRSPCNSPTTAEILHHHKTAKDLPTKSHSTCSDGSLLSMGSSEMDEDSFGHTSRHSSKQSLFHHDLSTKSSKPDSSTSTAHFIELGPSASHVQPLNHSAAHHRVAVRPKRTHGAPRRRRTHVKESTLPATPEVNEDFTMRGVSPDVLDSFAGTTASTVGTAGTGTSTKTTTAASTITTELFSLSNTTSTTTTATSKTTLNINSKATLTESQLKCSSLPPGLVGPSSESRLFILNRSKSNSSSKSQEQLDPGHQEDSKDGKDKEDGKSFIRKFIRNSGKKKKAKEKHQEHLLFTQQTQHLQQSIQQQQSVQHLQQNVVVVNDSSKPMVAPRSTAATRQRVIPKNIPSTPEEEKRNSNVPDVQLRKSSVEKIDKLDKPDKIVKPFELELENRLKQRQTLQFGSPPQSPKKTDSTSPRKVSPSVIPKSETKLAEFSSKSEFVQKSESIGKIAHFPDNLDKPDKTKMVKKSQSFKSSKKDNLFETANKFHKASSTDSIQVDNFKLDLNCEDLPSLEISPDIKELTKELVDVADSVKVHQIDYKTDNLQQNLLNSGITISGPSHTAVVNITSNQKLEQFTKQQKLVQNTDSNNLHVKETTSQVSVTKIQLKHETTTTTTNANIAELVPEFFNKQLNKIEPKPDKNIIFTNFPNKPEKRPTTLNFDSDVNMDIIEKVRKSPVSTPETPNLDLSHSPDRLSQNSIESTNSGVVMRKKSFANSTKSEEPELMKVFAKRSKIFGESEIEQLQQEISQFNSENVHKNELSDLNNKSEHNLKTTINNNNNLKTEQIEERPKIAELIAEKQELMESTAEVTLRKPIKAPRAFSLVQKSPEIPLKKPEKRAHSFWPKSEDLITEIVQKDEKFGEEIVIEKKNFSQRKAEWEKRAQLAQKSNVS